jgi:hypothetical protein
MERYTNYPAEFLIDTPYFKSALYPYYCTEASTEMVYKFFCKDSKVTQPKIEDGGSRTYEGFKEHNDIGAFNFFKKIGFQVTQIDRPEFEGLKKTLYENQTPVMVRLQNRKDHEMHTVVMVGYKDRSLIIHDPDTGPNNVFKVPNKHYDITSALIVYKPEKCNI